MPYFFHQHGGLGGLVIDKGGGGGVLLHEPGHRLGVLVQKLAAHQQHGGNQLAVAAQGVPLLRQVRATRRPSTWPMATTTKGWGSMATALS